jgi:hypothetical protein
MVAALAAATTFGCDDNERAAPHYPSAPTASVSASTGALDKRSLPVPSAPRCTAPSYDAHGPLDARSEASLANCGPVRTGDPKAALNCGLGGEEPALDLTTFNSAVLPVSEATRAHVRDIIAAGRKRGRKPHVVGFVGDSMTVSGAFMRPFAARNLAAAKQRKTGGIELDAAVKVALQSDGGTIIDRYQGKQAQRVSGFWYDSFDAPRAAKVGARAVWALEGGPEAPLRMLIKSLSPAFAVVLYGGNDAAWRAAPVGELADAFEKDLGKVLDELEQAGIVPIMSTLARHGHTPGIDDCEDESGMSNWRISVYTNALSARVVEMACKRRLPLIDLRHSLDHAVSRGLGPDGMHLSSHVHGGGKLTARGLRCGDNVRNYVTLRMLAQLEPLLTSASQP